MDFATVSVKRAAGLLGGYGVKLLTQNAGSQNGIDNITFRENVESDQSLLLGGELIITNTDVLKQIGDKGRMLREYKQNSAAGLLVFILSEADAGLLGEGFLSAANALEFPVLSAPNTVPYAIITSKIYEEIFNSHALSMEDYSGVIKAFTKILLLPEPSVLDVCKTLQAVLRQSTVIYDEYGYLLARSLEEQDAGLLNAHLSSASSYSFFMRLKAQFQEADQEEMRRSRTAICNRAYCQTLFKAMVQHKPVYFALWTRSGLTKRDEQVMNIAFLQAARTISVIRTQDRKRRLNRKRELEELYSLAFRDGADRVNNLTMLAAKLNISAHSLHQVAVVEAGPEGEGPLREQEAMLERIDRRMVYFQDKAVVLQDPMGFAVVMHGGPHVSPPFLRQTVQAYLGGVFEELTAQFRPYTFYIGVGKDQPSLNRLKDSYQQAADAIRLAKKLKAGPGVYFFGNMGIYSLLGVRTMEEFYANCRDELEVFLGNGDKNAAVILDTLETYFDTGKSMQATAKALDIHVNTVKYRIEKAKDAFGSAYIGDGEQSLKLHLLLKMRKLL